MADRILIWHRADGGNDLPRFYMESEYEPVGLRVMSRQNPGSEIVVDIFDDGASILYNEATVAGGDIIEELGDDFIEGIIFDEGSVMTCTITGGNDVTVQLELDKGDVDE